jgi:hypothetical protein
LIDERVARLNAHRQNIARYRLLLETSLTNLERASIQQLLAQETSAAENLTASTHGCIDALQLAGRRKPTSTAGPVEAPTITTGVQ